MTPDDTINLNDSIDTIIDPPTSPVAELLQHMATEIQKLQIRCPCLYARLPEECCTECSSLNAHSDYCDCNGLGYTVLEPERAVFPMLKELFLLGFTYELTPTAFVIRKGAYGARGAPTEPLILSRMEWSVSLYSANDDIGRIIRASYQAWLAGKEQDASSAAASS